MKQTASRRLSIVIPTLDEAVDLDARLGALQLLRAGGAEIVVIDGGSRDETIELATSVADRVIRSAPGRARQMNTGAAASHGDILLFLHADTLLPSDAQQLVHAALDHEHCWGRFDIRLVGRPVMLKVISALMNRRSRLTGIATGDQAMFMTRDAFDVVGGFPDQSLMEDIEMSKRLKRLSNPACLHARVDSSGRRWERHGTWRTILLMWSLRFRYWRGADPEALAALYHQAR